MKKYAFLAGIAACLLLLLTGQFFGFLACFAALFLWIAWETSRRKGPSFLHKKGRVAEAAMQLGREIGEFSLSHDGQWALFALSDHSLSMRDAQGRERWARPMEARTLAMLALPGGGAYFALPDEISTLR